MTLVSILCGVSAGKASALAFATALELARSSDAALTLVHVCPVPSGLYVYGPTSGRLGDVLALDALEQSGAELLARLVAHARVEGVPALRSLLVGDPATGIVGLAERERHDLIVLGKPAERRGLDRLLRGSMIDRVLRSSSRPVLLVPAGADGAGRLTRAT